MDSAHLPAPPRGGPRPEVPPPPERERKSRGKLVVTIVALFGLGALIGGVGVWLFTPQPCDGAEFVSTRFGYCLDLAEGWTATQSSEDPSGLDAFRATDTAALMYIEAIDLPDEQNLAGFAEQVRSQDQSAGFDLGDPTEGRLGGAPTAQWDVTISSPSGDTLVRSVVLVRDGIGWRIQIADSSASPTSSESEVQAMLDSWRFS